MPKRKSLKPIPKFDSEDEEREFWATHDSTDYVDWSRIKRRGPVDAPASVDCRGGFLRGLILLSTLSSIAESLAPSPAPRGRVGEGDHRICEICRRSSSFSNAMPTCAVASSRMSMSSIGWSRSPLSA